MIVIPSREFNKSVEKIKDNVAKERLAKLVYNLENANNLNEISNVVSLRNFQNLYRIRIGNYRLIVSHEKNTIEILLVEFLKRNENTYKFN